MTVQARGNQHGASPAPVLLITGFAIFVVLIGYLLVSSLAPKDTAVYDPSPIDPSAAVVEGLVSDTVTIDAFDPTTWVFFDFDRNSIVVPPDTGGWDLAIRRFTVIVSGAVADMGSISFDGLDRMPSAGFVETTFGSDTVNTAIDRWYTYSMWSHLLEPNDHVYVVRTRETHFAKLEFLSYYCPGMVGGCVTFRYVYRP
jgi:hypothetical protein